MRICTPLLPGHSLSCPPNAATLSPARHAAAPQAPRLPATRTGAHTAKTCTHLHGCSRAYRYTGVMGKRARRAQRTPQVTEPQQPPDHMARVRVDDDVWREFRASACARPADLGAGERRRLADRGRRRVAERLLGEPRLAGRVGRVVRVDLGRAR